MNIHEIRRQRKTFFSDCCQKPFTYNSNGLWTYYVCNCGQKTTPINGKGKMLDLHGVIRNVDRALLSKNKK